MRSRELAPSGPQIVVADLAKSFRVAVRTPGMRGAVAGLFRRRYQDVQALHGVSFSIAQGELVGYIGPNGAGKSTTIKILCGILTPTSGRCEIDGLTPWLQRARHVARLGAVFGQRTQLWWDLPVVESFELLRDIYRVDPARYRRTFEELVALMDVSTLLDTPVRQLSLGQRMRCDLVAALLHEPTLLFLDEPTIGLDAVSKLAVRQFIKRLNRERGVTVILTTHDMDDVEALCERVLVINHGTLLIDGTLRDLRTRMGNQRRLIVDFENAAEIMPLPNTRIIERDGARVVFGFDPGVVPVAQLIGELTQAHAVRDLTVDHQPIEEIIAALYLDAKPTRGADTGGTKATAS